MLKPLHLVPVALMCAVPLGAEDAVPTEQTWAFEHSDLEAEQGYIFGQLDNGMRYIIRRNDRPEQTALVRMEIAAGRLDERDDERGLAHFVEHMAFNGSTNVPEGEMIKLLERLGLAFGADTNASTSFEYTQYKLDLPRADEQLLDTALMLMRETASELLFEEDSVERERGVLLAERRDRTTYQRINAADAVDFFMPGSLFANRYPILDREDVDTVDAATLQGFWQRNYIPAKTTVVVVGDFDPALVEAKIKERFADWRPADAIAQPDAGPVNPDLKDATDIYLHPALDEEIVIARNAQFVDEPDSRATRATELQRAIATSIVNRRLQKLALAGDPPFRRARFGTGDIFETARQTSLTISAIEGQWERGMDAAIAELRQALAYGFSDAELAEQIARYRTGYENAVSSADTRSNGSFVGAAIGLARNDSVPLSPQESLALFEQVVASATPQSVLAAMVEHAVPLEEALIRFEGRTAPEGGQQALRTAFARAMAAPVARRDFAEAASFAYTDFGEPGTVVSDVTGEELGIRRIRFANNVMLNLKRTQLEDDRVHVAVTLDGGSLLDTRERPLGTALANLLASGGLGAHSVDDLQTILAGRTVRSSIGKATDSFTLNAITTPRDLELQLQLTTAYLTDPGYREDAIIRYRNGLDDFFARLDATPSAALSSSLGTIISDEDPRFSLQAQDAYAALDFDDLRATIDDRLKGGALEVALVGDFDEARAIELVAATLGALPERELDFRVLAENRQRSFTANRSDRVLTHRGEDDQALVTYIWPTTDDSDVETVSAFNLLSAITRLELTETLREKLGKTYSPSVSSNQSHFYPDWGIFSLAATVEPGELTATRSAIDETVSGLRTMPVDDDTIQRAREPILARFDNMLKTNGGWMALTRRAQSQPERIGRFLGAKNRYEALSAEDVRSLAQRYLDPAVALPVVVVPKPADSVQED